MDLEGQSASRGRQDVVCSHPPEVRRSRGANPPHAHTKDYVSQEGHVWGNQGMDEYQVRTWHGWHHHLVLSLLAVWFLIGETHRGQALTPALTLPQVRDALSLLLLAVLCPLGVEDICRRVQRQLRRNELARFYHHRTRKYIPPRKLHREIQ